MASSNYKPAQPLHLRQLNQRFELDHKTKNCKINFSANFKDSIGQLIVEFGRKSTIHGLNRIFQKKSTKYERIFWVITVIYALLGSIYVCITLSQRFNAGTFKTVVNSTNAPVYILPFPEISICNANHLNWGRIEEAKNLFIPHENDTEKIRLFETVISLYDNVSFGEFYEFIALEGEPVELVNHINFSAVFEFMTWRCEEFLSNCTWRHFKVDCCEIFQRIRGQEGLCWHFNTLSSEESRRKQQLDDKYPWRTGSAGPKSGLTVRLWLNEDKHYHQDNEKGVTVAVLEPGVFHRDPFFVPANTETAVEVEPVAYFHDNGTRNLPFARRKCIFNEETSLYASTSLPNFPYMLENCFTLCYQEYLMRYCNCTIDILFPPAEYNACKATDLLCLAKNDVYFKFTHQFGEEDFLHSDYRGMVCNCVRNCYSLNYVADVRPSFFPEQPRRSRMYVDLDVHYRIETMFVYRTSLVFGWLDLVVAFGGIVGLFLGCSLISGMELLYLILIEFPTFIFKKLRLKTKLQKVHNQNSNGYQSNKIPLKRRNRGFHNHIMAPVNYKPAQPLALRQLNQKYELNNINRQKRNNNIKLTHKFKESAIQLLYDFGQKSTIHGTNRIAQENATKYERYFWTLILIYAIIGCIYICLILSQRFNAGVFQTVVDSTDKPVFHIPFPEVTICNENQLNWDRIEEAKQLFMPNENDAEKIRLFEKVIGLYDNITFGVFGQFRVLKGEPLELVNHVNFSSVFDFMTWRCEEFLTDCKWRHFEKNCCDIFVRSRGQDGICWHFNTLSTEEARQKQLVDKKYPWRTGNAGPESALTVRVLINEEKHYRQDNEKGIWVAILEPGIFHRDPLFIPSNTETLVEVDPIVYYHDNGTRRLPPSQRNCMFHDERHRYEYKYLDGFTYKLENCYSHCYQEYLMKYCNCTMEFLFPPASYPACKAKDLLCLGQHNDYLEFNHEVGEENFVRREYHGMICNCIRSCYSLNYVIDIRPSFLPIHETDNKTIIDLDVHFRIETMFVYRTSLVFGWVDLMVAFGGIVGLFLGCSLLSGMELVYFVLLELPIFIMRTLRTKKKYNDKPLSNATDYKYEPKKKLKFSRQFKDSVKKLAINFGTTFCNPPYMELFWFLTFASALLGSIYVCLILSQRFNAGSFETVVDSTNDPVFHIPFPEITICNANHLNWQRIEEAKHRFMPHENNTEKLQMFEFVIGLYDNLSFGGFEEFANLKDKPLDLVKNVNFSLVYEFMSWRCEEFLTDCVWRHYKIKCCDVFSRSRGQNGLCWHFNTLSTEEGRRKKLMDSKYPWRTGSAGPRTGLTLRVLLNEDKHYRKDNEKGITVGVMEPEVFHRDPFWVPANSETVVEVEPVVYFYDNDTRGLSSNQRRCVFKDEHNSHDFKTLNGFTYMIENCQTQCHQEYLLKHCNCTLDILFPADKYAACQVKDLICLADNNDYFRFTHQFGEEEYVRSDYHGMICKCFRNCYSLNYVTDVRPSFLPAYLRDNRTYIDLDVHFRFDTMMVYRTSLVFGWVDLMVAFGGIAGLFLGCSLISAMELIYFVLVELPVFLLSELKVKRKYEDDQQNKERYETHMPSKRQNWAIKQLNRKFELEQKHLQEKKRTQEFVQQFKKSAQQFAINFGRKSTIHGINRIFQDDSNHYERFFWLFSLICAFLGTIYVCLILSQRFNAGNLETIIESTNRPVFYIPFPEVAICNANNLNWQRLEEAKHRFMPHENNTEKIRLFEMVIGLYDNISFGKFEHFQALKNKPLKLVNNVNFSLVFDFMTWRCEELLTDCVWRRYKINCCDVFLRSRGSNGICWHFNTLSTEEGKRKQLLDNKYPYRTGSAGPKSGLNVRVLLNEEKHYRQDNEKGITVGIMEPKVFHKDPTWVPANTETVVEVEPVIYLYDNDTRTLSSDQRKCLFHDERSSYDFKSLAGFSYMIENCQAQCHQEHLLKYCNCTLDLLFPPAQYKACKVKDLLCLAKYNDHFRFYHQFGEEEFVHSYYQGMICKCFRNCYSLNFVTDVRPSFLPAFIRENKTYVDLDVHFRFETMMVYRTSLVFGWVDLMVAFGGIAGLFLGCSLISGIELLYFVFVEFPVFMFNEFNEFKTKTSYKKVDNLESNQQQQLKKVPVKQRNWGLNNRIMAAQHMEHNEFMFNKNNFNNINEEAQH
ncbi:Pickpocket protein 19 [Lucilia cuprina]|nr:Pickpocket protein 19 [Lucilia cuprina]